MLAVPHKFHMYLFTFIGSLAYFGVKLTFLFVLVIGCAVRVMEKQQIEYSFVCLYASLPMPLFSLLPSV